MAAARVGWLHRQPKEVHRHELRLVSRNLCSEGRLERWDIFGYGRCDNAVVDINVTVRNSISSRPRDVPSSREETFAETVAALSDRFDSCRQTEAYRVGHGLIVKISSSQM